MNNCVLILIAAVALDLIAGDPVYALHPVRLIGKVCHYIETTFRRIGLSGKFGGILLLFAVLGITICVYLCFVLLLKHVHFFPTLIFNIFVVYSCVALKDLLYRTKRVALSLEQKNLPQAQQRVQKIIGRDANMLDEPGIARAAIESVAENFVDGFLSPIFWYIAAGMCALYFRIDYCIGAVMGVLCFRVINTLDSMVGHRNQRYKDFGWASARWDDMINFLPARIALPIISTAAFICKLDGKDCIKVGLRDRLKHPSPNAGHAESSMAGALGIRLGGPSVYSYGRVDKPWLGNGRRDVSYVHIYTARALIFWSGMVVMGLSVIAGILFL